MEEQIPGLHHVAGRCRPANAIDFYTGVLGLRLVKLTGPHHVCLAMETAKACCHAARVAWVAARARTALPQLRVIHAIRAIGLAPPTGGCR
jgi:catechol 2,3-dioxygenase-like lactoylglutathione lyase family enzyme